MQQWALVALIGGIISAIALVLYWLFSGKETKPKISEVKVVPSPSVTTPPQEPTAPMIQQVEPLKPEALTTPEPSSTSIETQTPKTSTETPSEQFPPPPVPIVSDVVKKSTRRRRSKDSKRKAKAPPSSETSQ